VSSITSPVSGFKFFSFLVLIDFFIGFNLLMVLKSTSTKVLPASGTVFLSINFFLPSLLNTPLISYTGGMVLPSLSNTGFLLAPIVGPSPVLVKVKFL